MSTLHRHAFNPRSLVQEARMVHSSKQKYTLFVEGETDYRLLRQWLVDSNARIKQVDGKDKVKAVWNESKIQNVNKIICLADMDYDCVINIEQIKDDHFVYVSTGSGDDNQDIESIDIESTLIRSGALLKVMSNKYRDTDLYDNEFSNRVNALREKIRKASSELGAFRAADMAYMKAHGRSPIGGELLVTEDYYDAVGVEVNIEILKTMLLRSSRVGGNAMDEVIERAEKLHRYYGDGWKLCRGHDLTEMLGLHLSTFMNRFVTHHEVEEDLRLACELGVLKKTRFGSHLIRIGESVGKPFLSVD